MTTHTDHEMVLYRINDALEALAYEFQASGRFDSEDEYDEMLNELTHHVAAEFGLTPRA